MPTFTAKFLRSGDTVLQCVQTGVRYIITAAGRDFAAYREGKLMLTGERRVCVNAVESDARWTQHDRLNQAREIVRRCNEKFRLNQEPTNAN